MHTNLAFRWRARQDSNQPHGPVVIVDGVADAAAAGYLVFPLLHVTGVVPVGGQVASEPVLAVVSCPGPRVGAEGLQASPGVGQGMAASSSHPSAASLVPNRTSH
jgi:hypothetical protein